MPETFPLHTEKQPNPFDKLSDEAILNLTGKLHALNFSAQDGETGTELKREARDLLIQLHPDKNPDDERALALSKAASQIFNILNNPQRATPEDFLNITQLIENIKDTTLPKKIEPHFVDSVDEVDKNEQAPPKTESQTLPEVMANDLYNLLITELNNRGKERIIKTIRNTFRKFANYHSLNVSDNELDIRLEISLTIDRHKSKNLVEVTLMDKSVLTLSEDKKTHDLQLIAWNVENCEDALMLLKNYAERNSAN